MSAQTSILPGWVPNPTPITCFGCDIAFIEISDGDAYDGWRAALNAGEQATRKYLGAHTERVTHGAGCEYANLPPSVHVHCWQRNGTPTRKAYAEELKRLLDKKYILS